LRYGIFTGFARPTRTKLVQMKQMGFDDAILCLISKRDFSGMRLPKYVAEDLSLIADCGMTPHIMYWVFRDKSFIDKMVSHFLLSVSGIPIGSVVLNCEADYHVGSFESKACALYLRSKFANFVMSVVGLPGLHSTVKDLLAVCDYGIPEAYSIWFPQEEPHWSHTKSTFPGTMQQDAYADWKHRPVVMGLGCYFGQRPGNQIHPPMSKELTMSMSLNETHRLGVLTAYYWSMPHLVRDNQNAIETMMCLKSEFQRYRVVP